MNPNNNNFEGINADDEINHLRQQEKNIINLDYMEEVGTHWTAFKNVNGEVIYYNSVGNFHPSKEVQSYF